MRVEPSKGAKLEVREARASDTSVSVADITGNYVASGMRGNFFEADVLRVLKPVIDR